LYYVTPENQSLYLKEFGHLSDCHKSCGVYYPAAAMFKSIRDTYTSLPRPFWVLMFASFIDRTGGFVLFPFFALYITQRFEVGMTEVGYVLFVLAVSGTIGSFIGGAIADRFGRRSIIVFGLIASAASSLLMAFATDLRTIYLLAGLIGLLQDVGGPAQSAMVADLLPAKRHAEGFGIWRVFVNIAAVIGPALGGFLASRNFFWLFVADAISSLLTAILAVSALPETKPKPKENQVQEGILKTLAGYGVVLRNNLFIVFLLISVLGTIVYAQMNTSMPVFLRDEHGIAPSGFGLLYSLNGAIVVLFQFWVIRRIRDFPQLIVMAVGTGFLALGFAMFGFGSTLAYFAVAMTVLTIGEMIAAPTGQAVAASFAPEDMRGRYMAMFGLAWALPFAVAPLLAGLIMDNYDPNWVWYWCGILGALCILGYLLLHRRAGARIANQKAASAAE
jgi:MFS family permease